MRAAITFVYITQITQTTGKSSQSKVTVNKIAKRNISSNVKPKVSYVHLHNIMSGTKKY